MHLTQAFTWTKMPPAIVAEGLVPTDWEIVNCVRSVTKTAAPAVLNSGKMIYGRRDPDKTI